ncbi:TetR/AcrR family transcriptional regulator [Bacillus marinisedimentorum]|uniref:TetR/AcrR family transcriptional regulator n=1 Tax=Bacillus marinisedimentorum TaxID=1821260 RepID=UPI0007E28A2A|nr:TetR/AcrR family transcriptional regulator [Bacillus marinisedimentorum]
MKQKIVQASIKLFEKQGFTETSIQDIVDSLNVTKGTFYYYFNSKEELLRDIHLDYISYVLEEQEKIIGDESKTARGKLRTIVTMLITSIESQGFMARIFFREIRNLSREHIEEITLRREKFLANLQQLIKTGIEKGEFKEGLNPDIVALGVLGMTNWSYQWFKPEGELSDTEVAGIFVEMILNGISLK